MKTLILLTLTVTLFAEVPKSEWTFKTKELMRGEIRALGLKKDPSFRSAFGVEKEKLKFDAGKLPAKFHLKERVELSPIFNQGSCGSCVYNSVVKNLEDSFRLRGIVHPRLSRQYLMDCAAEWSCSGSFFEKVAGGLVNKGGTATEASYPYKAYDQSCRGASELLAKVQSYKIIDNSPKSIMSALYAGYPVSVTVGAGGSYMNYDSGIYNDCQNIGTNHEVLIYGWDCETSVDSEGNCKFDSNGKLPNGVGFWHQPNSWGTNYGEEGNIRIKITSRSGALCNNIAEEAGILETGIPVPSPTVTPTPSPVPPTPNGPTNWTLVTAIGAAVMSLIAIILVLVKKS